jgi:hypothetical protein
MALTTQMFLNRRANHAAEGFFLQRHALAA